MVTTYDQSAFLSNNLAVLPRPALDERTLGDRTGLPYFKPSSARDEISISRLRTNSFARRRLAKRMIRLRWQRHQILADRNAAVCRGETYHSPSLMRLLEVCEEQLDSCRQQSRQLRSHRQFERAEVCGGAAG